MEQNSIGIGKIIALMIVLFVIVTTVVGSVATVSAGHRGVLLTYGKVEDRILPEGISFITPYVNSVVVMSIQTQKYSATASSASKDLQIVKTEVTLNYKLSEGSINKIYQELGVGFEDSVIQPAIQEVVKQVTAKYTAEELITKRESVKAEIESALSERLSKFGGITVQTVSITDFNFSDEFNKAIEAKVTAEQSALAAKNKLEQVKYEADQRVAQATAEAEAIKIQAQALLANQQLVNYEWVKRWNGQLPQTLMMGNTQSMILLPTGNSTLGV